jgi:hypothetical protein
MNQRTLRQLFSRHRLTTGGSTLRRLARKIATYTLEEAKEAGLFTAEPPPYNCLANGKDEYYWHPSYPVSDPDEICRTKFQQLAFRRDCPHGFGSRSYNCSWGLALLFDPLVDAVMSAHLGLDEFQPNSTVVLLSDFGSIKDTVVNVIDASHNDWGDEETSKIQRGLLADKTIPPFFKGIDPDWRNGEMPAEAIRAKNVFVWNFMPFFRGSKFTSNAHGLPCEDHGWKKQCWLWTSEFVAAVRARRVVICVNKKHMIKVRTSATAPLTSADFVPAQSSYPADVGADVKIFALPHPCSNAFNPDDLQQILSKSL